MPLWLEGVAVVGKTRLKRSHSQRSRLRLIATRGYRNAQQSYRGGSVSRRSEARGVYSAATRVTGSAASTLAAQNLNSGILPNGASFGLVRRFAAAST